MLGFFCVCLIFVAPHAWRLLDAGNLVEERWELVENSCARGTWFLVVFFWKHLWVMDIGYGWGHSLLFRLYIFFVCKVIVVGSCVRTMSCGASYGIMGVCNLVEKWKTCSMEFVCILCFARWCDPVRATAHFLSYTFPWKLEESHWVNQGRHLRHITFSMTVRSGHLGSKLKPFDKQNLFAPKYYFHTAQTRNVVIAFSVEAKRWSLLLLLAINCHH